MLKKQYVERINLWRDVLLNCLFIGLLIDKATHVVYCVCHTLPFLGSALPSISQGRTWVVRPDLMRLPFPGQTEQVLLLWLEAHLSLVSQMSVL